MVGSQERAGLEPARTKNFIKLLRLKRDFAVAVGVDHAGIVMLGFTGCKRIVNMDMTMQMQSGFEGLNQPTEGIHALVSRVILIMDSSRGGMGDENIEVAAIGDLIHH